MDISRDNEALLSAEYARSLLIYEPNTGKLYWKQSIGRRKAGVNLTSTRIKVNGVLYSRNRLCWLLFYGEWPMQLVDHKNGARFDDRIDNLREATPTQNQYNRTSTGAYPKGVTKKNDRNRTKPWQAKIRVNGQRVHLGCFETMEEAATAYRLAARKYHGEFAIA